MLILTTILTAFLNALSLGSLAGYVVSALVGLVCHRLVGIVVEKLGNKISGKPVPMRFNLAQQIGPPSFRERVGEPIAQLGRWL